MPGEKNFAHNLRALRFSQNLKQRQIAEELHVSVQTVSKWEQGVMLPDLTNLCRLADLLEVSPGALLEERRAHKPVAFLAADGGGSKTDMALCAPDGRILRRVKCPGSNPTVCGIGKTIEILLSGADALGAGAYAIAGVFLGIAGCPDELRRGALIEAFSLRFPDASVDADADVVNVIYSTEHRKNCIAAICGTGSVAFAEKGGRLLRVGGWGPLFDNAGSGFDIGRDAVRAALAEEDGFGEKTVLTDVLRERLGACIFDCAASISPTDFSGVAALAPLVFEADAEGDAVAAGILERNFGRLAFLINTAAEQYGCGPHVVLSGGVTAHARAVRRYLEPHLDPGLTLTFPRVSQIVGALAKARELGGADSSLPAGNE